MEKRADMREILVEFLAGIPALLMPFIIMGGIFSGITTPTEAGVFSGWHMLMFLSVVVYRELSFCMTSTGSAGGWGARRQPS